MKLRKAIVAFILLAAFTSFGFAGPPGTRPQFKDTLVRVEAKFTPETAKPGDTVTWQLVVEVLPRWHTYPTRQEDPEASTLVTRFSWPQDSVLTAEGGVTDPPGGSSKAEPKLNIQAYRYYEGVAVWEQKFRVSDKAANGEITFTPRVRLTVCDEHGCLPGAITPQAKLTVFNGNVAAPLTPAPTQTLPNQLQSHNESPANLNGEYRSQLESILAQLQKLKPPVHSGLWKFLLTAVFWGGVSLLTPCVFPMIPITVSFFLKQSEKSHANPVILALVYCATIVAVLGTASLTLLSFFTALSINPLMNVFIGLLFVVLALSLFGMYDLTLPTFLTRFTSSREGRGGLIGTVFMALTFTVVSFTCVAPFLGGFGGMAASGNFTKFELVLGAFAFAATFAAPFFVLAIFPSMIRRLPKSGGWLHTVKIVMGFVELAAALKFFRAAELVRFAEATFFTYDLVLGMWVALALLCGLYLFKLIHIGPHAEEEPGVSVPRFLTGFVFVSLAFYLVPALFSGGPEGGNHRPRGSVFAWVDAFILPDSGDSRFAEARWSGNLPKAIADARAEQKSTGQPNYVFVDFTGETCANCRFNERNILNRGDIKQLLQKYRLVQLYTDKVPDQFYPLEVRSKLSSVDRQIADAEVNRWFQQEAFGESMLPLYAILEPTAHGIRVVGVYPESKINDIASFAQFLSKPLVAPVALAGR